MPHKIGVYVCHCGTNIASKVDCAEVARFASGLKNVVIARDYQFMCSDPGQDMIISDINELGLNRVVVASCSPQLHEKTFQNACQNAGLNPYLFQMACIREHCSWVIEDPVEATEKAMHLVTAAVNRVDQHHELFAPEIQVRPGIMVVGAGIAGIQAALDIADARQKVYLVEKAPSIGGHMAQFDKTFPTLDCAACISTPKMVAVAQNPYIEMLTYSEVIEVTGYIGDYLVKVRRKPRYVNDDVCTGCGLCIDKCPVKVPSEFDELLGTRKAIYRYTPQSVPLTPVIDPEHCRYLTKGKGRVCEQLCPAQAIDFTQEETELTIPVGSIILATGYDLFDPTPLWQYGFNRFDEVYTGLQFERLNSPVGPSGGEIIMKNGNPPEGVAILHCVGSRDQNYHEYCSRVCCMYALKYAHLLREKVGPDVPIYNFYIDLRCFGKGYEEFYHRVQEKGIVFIRGRPAQVTDQALTPEEEGKLIVISEDTLLGEMLRVPVDMVILCTAMEPSREAAETARIFGVSQGQDGFFLEEHPKLGPITTTTDGIFLAGACQGPKDIPDSVSHASGAAAKALALATRGTVTVSPATAWIDPDICSGCLTCRELCVYSAIEFDEYRGVCVVNETVCKGCGSCAAFCPSNAAQIKHFTEKQIFAEIEGLLDRVSSQSA
ncbi:MAG: CoB--CoM heterodisulfide reductase iron-sulfur subunit A family protein [Deltaproteobacteria bacterium]|nr:CoB--CoM heterodisulfide reductase iron-sulfur subunit A family protein [Deltaproteobacteria bacterium]